MKTLPYAGRESHSLCETFKHSGSAVPSTLQIQFSPLCFSRHQAARRRVTGQLALGFLSAATEPSTPVAPAGICHQFVRMTRMSLMKPFDPDKPRSYPTPSTSSRSNAPFSPALTVAEVCGTSPRLSGI